MWNVSKIFVQLSFSDSQLVWAWMTTVMKDSQPEHGHLCTKGNRCVSAATFGLGSWVQHLLTRRFTGLAYDYKHPVVWKDSAYRGCRRRQRFCYMLMCDDFLLLSPKIPQVRTMHTWLCSDLACVCNSQSNCVVVEEMHGSIVCYYSMTCSSLQVWQFSLSY